MLCVQTFNVVYGSWILQFIFKYKLKLVIYHFYNNEIVYL